MRILCSNSFLVDEFEPDIWVTCNFENFDIPYTLFYNGESVFLYGRYRLIDTFLNNSKQIIMFDNIKIGILVGKEMAVPENYLEDVDLFFTFERTSFVSKFLLRKAQALVGSDISSKPVLSLLLYKDKANYVKVMPDVGIVSDSMSYVIYESGLRRSEVI